MEMGALSLLHRVHLAHERRRLMELRQLRKGMMVSWDWMPREAWGCTYPVPAIVMRVRITRVKSVQIQVVRDDGKIILKWVKPITLFPYVEEVAA